MGAINGIIQKAKSTVEEVITYWNYPRPGEYVPYKEITKLSIGWMAFYFVFQFSVNFGVGNELTGATLGMNNTELLIMGYICQFIGYIQAPINAWITDNLRSKDANTEYT